jgi:hypothetical protein
MVQREKYVILLRMRGQRSRPAIVPTARSDNGETVEPDDKERQREKKDASHGGSLFYHIDIGLFDNSVTITDDRNRYMLGVSLFPSIWYNLQVFAVIFEEAGRGTP